MNNTSSFLANLTQAEKDEISTLSLAQDFLVLFEQVMNEQKVSRKELAQRIGTSPSYVTQLFKADRVPNLEVIAKMKDRLGITFHIQLKRENRMHKLIPQIFDEGFSTELAEVDTDEEVNPFNLKYSTPSRESLVA